MSLGFLILGPFLCHASPMAQAVPHGTVIVSNMNDNTATLLNAATGATIATLPTGEGPHEVAMSRDGRWALVSNYGPRGKPGNTLTVIDVLGASVARTIMLEGNQRPHGMVFLPGDTLVAVTAETKGALLLVDFRSGRFVRTLSTGGRTPHIVSLTAKGDHLFTGNIGSGTVADFDLAGSDTGRVIRVGRQPEGIAVAPDGATVWAGSNLDSIVVVADTKRGVPIDTLRGFGLAYRIAITPDSKTAVITDPVRGEIRAFHVADRKPLFTIAVPRDSLVATAEIPGSPSPEGVTVSGDSRWAFVTLQGRNRLAIVDLTLGKIIRTDVIGTWSDGVAWSALVRR